MAHQQQLRAAAAALASGGGGPGNSGAPGPVGSINVGNGVGSGGLNPMQMQQQQMLMMNGGRGGVPGAAGAGPMNPIGAGANAAMNPMNMSMMGMGVGMGGMGMPMGSITMPHGGPQGQNPNPNNNAGNPSAALALQSLGNFAPGVGGAGGMNLADPSSGIQQAGAQQNNQQQPNSNSNSHLANAQGQMQAHHVQQMKGLAQAFAQPPNVNNQQVPNPMSMPNLGQSGVVPSAGGMMPPPQTPRISSSSSSHAALGQQQQTPGQIHISPSNTFPTPHHSAVANAQVPPSRGQSKERERERQHSPTASISSRHGHGHDNRHGHGHDSRHAHGHGHRASSSGSGIPTLTNGAASGSAVHLPQSVHTQHSTPGHPQPPSHSQLPHAQPHPPQGGILHQLDQLKAIQRQQDLILRQEQATLLGIKSSHSGAPPNPPTVGGASGSGANATVPAGGTPNPAYASLLKDVYGETNPKWPTPAGAAGAVDKSAKGKGKALVTASAASSKADEADAGSESDNKKKAQIEAREKEVLSLPPSVLSQRLGEVYAPLKDINLSTTRISVLPAPTSSSDVTHGGSLPELTEADVLYAKESLIDRDMEYEKEWREMRSRMDDEVRLDTSSGGAGGVKWWERDATVPASAEEMALRAAVNKRFDVVFPANGRALREKKRQRADVKFPRPNRKDFKKVEELVPIRVEIEQDGHRLRETFVWNLSDSLVTPELFAQITCEDLELPLSFRNTLASHIRSQLSEYALQKVDFPTIAPTSSASSKKKDSKTGAATEAPTHGTLDEADDEWWTTWRKKIRVDQEGASIRIGEKDASSEPMSSAVPIFITDVDGDTVVKTEIEDKSNDTNVSALMIPSTPNGVMRRRKTPVRTPSSEKGTKVVHLVVDDDESQELRVLIRLDITVGWIQLTDQFEWDLNDLDASPERFAQVYAADLGLSGEFTTAIAHQIREQALIFRKSLATSGYSFDGSEVVDDELREFFLPSLSTATRNLDQVEWFMPKINYLNELDLERMERDREREIKRKKRLGKARQKLNVPEREPPKTQRTMPGATEVTLPPQQIAAAPVGRRAAAAATAIIATLAAAENSDAPPGAQPGRFGATPTSQGQGQSIMQSSAPGAGLPSKVKKVVMLHAPPIKDDLYLPRAKLGLDPTQSTSLRPAGSYNRGRGDGEGGTYSRPPTALSASARPVSHGARTAKEISDAKIKEYAEGLHPVMVNGLWHCSVCGCPDDIAIGRRKGPLGEKTMCGDCGKYYHRYRRPNDSVVYTTDREYHLAKRRGDDSRRFKKKPPASRLLAEIAPIAVSNHPTETPLSDDDDDDDDDVPLASRAKAHTRIVSPELSDLESVKEGASPTKNRTVGTASNSSLSPPPPVPLNLPPANSAPSQPPPSTQLTPSANSPPLPLPPVLHGLNPGSPVPPRPVLRRPASLVPPSDTPQWLKDRIEETAANWPNDIFGPLKRPPQGGNPDAPPEWRIKCYDCPGLIYKPGPGETLDNFVVHLRNRNHRTHVNMRIKGEPVPVQSGATKAAAVITPTTPTVPLTPQPNMTDTAPSPT